MTHTERRLNHQLEAWIIETVHASTASDEQVLAQIKARLASKADAIFRKRFAVMGPN